MYSFFKGTSFSSDLVAVSSDNFLTKASCSSRFADMAY